MQAARWAVGAVRRRGVDARAAPGVDRVRSVRTDLLVVVGAVHAVDEDHRSEPMAETVSASGPSVQGLAMAVGAVSLRVGGGRSGALFLAALWPAAASTAARALPSLVGARVGRHRRQDGRAAARRRRSSIADGTELQARPTSWIVGRRPRRPVRRPPGAARAGIGGLSAERLGERRPVALGPAQRA
jgi:hypothetical protein